MKLFGLRIFVAISSTIALSKTLLGCGLNWSSPPSDEWMNADRDGTFRYWDTIDQVKISDTENMPLRIVFSPGSSYDPLLGLGWRFPLFDSRIEKVSENVYTIYQPDGQVNTIKPDPKQPKILTGDGWAAKVFGNKVSCVASCGWEMEFENGRLSKLTSPAGKEINVFRSPTLYSLKSGNETIATFNKQRAELITGEVEGKKIDLKISPRMLSDAERQSTGLDIASSLSEISSCGKLYKYYRFDRPLDKNTGEMKFETAQDSFRWGNKDNKISFRNGREISFSMLHGIYCMHTKYDGWNTTEGRNDLISIRQSPRQPAYLIERTLVGNAGEKPRKVYELLPNGEKQIIREYLYNQEGQIISDLQHFKDKDSGEWVEYIKRFNGAGELIALSKGGWRASFEHKGDIVAVIVDSQNGRKISTIGKEIFNKVFLER